MEVMFIPGNEMNSDLGVVNAARVSLNKKSAMEKVNIEETVYEHLNDTDTRLIQYLARHNHWTPFAHARLYFEIAWQNYKEELDFYKQANCAGFAWHESMTLPWLVDYVKGSLYGWITQLPHFPSRMQEHITDAIFARYPVVGATFFSQEQYPSFQPHSGCMELLEPFIIDQRLWKIATATLRVKVPIFVARQIRTSQIGISYSDSYVENEAFVCNEVSRRYVNDDPEFYAIEQWRVREGKGVKQGSTGIANADVNTRFKIGQRIVTNQAAYEYDTGNYQYKIAPEQLRALLPQSMYTEFYMTATLHRWAQFIALRAKRDVQQETREIVYKIALELAKHFPHWNEDYTLLEGFSQ